MAFPQVGVTPQPDTTALPEQAVTQGAEVRGGLGPARPGQRIRLLPDHDSAVTTHVPTGPAPFPPPWQLHQAGVRLCSGNDGVRDTWGAPNNGDELGRADWIACRSGAARRRRAGAGAGDVQHDGRAAPGPARPRAGTKVPGPFWCWCVPRRCVL